jgi:tetratricopeptide (TPR) repeat protein
VRTLNLRLAIILLIIAIVGGASVYALHGFQQRRNAYFFLEQAELAQQQAAKAAKENKPEEEQEAIKEQMKNLEWYLTLRRSDWDVLEKLGMLRAEHIVDLPSFRQAYECLDRLVREDPTRKEARRKLIDLLILAARFSDARLHLDYLLKETPDDPELLFLLGQCQEGMGEEETAVTYYQKTIKYSPKTIEVYPRLANLLQTSLERTKEADACMQELVKNNPDSAKAQILLAAYLQKTGVDLAKRSYDEEAQKASEKAYEEALQAVEKALELAPNEKDEKNALLLEKDALLLGAQCALNSGDLEKARKYAQRCREVYKDCIPAYLTLADIFERSRERDKALDVLDQGLKETKNAPQLLWSRVNLLIDAGDLKSASEGLEKLQDAKYPKPLQDYLGARLAFGNKEWADAKRRFEKVRPAMSNSPNFVKQIDLWLGYCYGRLNNTDQEIDSYQRALRADPFYAPARQLLTDALIKAGRTDEAVAEYYKLIKLGKIPSSGRIVFANLLIRQNLERNVDERNWTPVEKILDDAEKDTPDAFQIPLLRSEMLHAQNRDKEAEEVLLKARDKHPQQLDFWHALVTMATLQKDWDKAEKFLKEFELRMGDCVDLRLTRADYLVQRHGAQSKEALKKLEENSGSFSDADRLRLLNGLLTAARRSGDRDLVKHYIDLLAQKDEGNLEVQYLRIEQAANEQDVAKLENVLNDVKKIEGEGPVWMVGQARLLTLQAKDDPALLDEAEKYLVQAQEIRPSWSRIPMLLAFIYDRQNKPVRTLTNLLKAISLGEHNPLIVRRAVQLLFQDQRYAEADKLLRRLDQEEVPLTPELTRLWVQLLIQRGEFDLAVTKARQTVSEKSDDYNEYLWLGQILGIAARRAKTEGKTTQAADLAAEGEKSLRRAVELKSEAAETWVALVQFLSSLDKIGAAEKVVEQAQGKIAAEQAPLALAECYEAIQKNDLAMEQYKLALAAKPDDPKIVRSVASFYQRIGKSVEAEALLKRIIEGKVKGDTDDLFWARRQMALITAAKGGMANMEAARGLIEENLAAAGNSADDLRIKATIDAVDPRRTRKDEAINVLTKMMDGQQASPEDRYRLALLYLSMEKQSPTRTGSDSNTNTDNDMESSAWSKARNILQNLVLSSGKNPIYMATYIKALLDHGDASSAELYLNRLTSEYPNYSATVVLQAETLVRRNQFEEALDLLKSFVDRENAVPQDRSQRIRTMAEAMESLAERIKDTGQKPMVDRYLRSAEMYYRQYVDEHPSQSLELVEFFVRQGQIEDAINFLEQYWENSDPITIAAACMKVAQYDKSSPENAERAEKVLLAAQSKFAKHPALMLTLGDMRFMQERYGEAENYYRELLHDNPGHAVALNNLALLLALQGKNLDESLSLINKAIEIAGPLSSMLDTRASVYIARGEAEKAIKDMDEVVADGATPVRLFHQAQALELGKQKFAAASTMQRALDAGLKKEMLQVLEIPAFERLKKLAQVQGTSQKDNP